MQLIECPWCGPREEVEFHYGGQAHVTYPDDPAALSDEEWAHYVFFRDNTKGLFAERWSHSHGLPPLVQRHPRHRHLPLPARLPPRRAEAGDPMSEIDKAPRRRSAPPDGRPHRPRHHPRIHLRRRAASPGTPATPWPRRCSPPAGTRSAPASSWAGRAASPRPGPRTRAASCRSRSRSPSRCCWPPPSSCTTDSSRTACRARAGSADVADSARYDAVHHHVDVLVVGAGPAGLTAALTAARAGARVALVDEQSEAGGVAAVRHRDRSTAPRRWTGSPPRSPSWPATPTCCTCSAPPRSAATTTGSSSRWSGAPTTSATQRREHLSRQRVWRIRATSRRRRDRARTSARSSSPTTTGPASCSRAPPAPSCTATACSPGREVVVFTTNDSAYDAARRPAPGRCAGARRRRRPAGGPRAPRRASCERAGHPRPPRRGSSTGTRGVERVTHALVAPAPATARSARSDRDRLRSAAGQRRVEPRGAPVQPGPRPAALRRPRSARSCPASSSTAMTVAGCGGRGCSTSPGASPTGIGRPGRHVTGARRRAAAATSTCRSRGRGAPSAATAGAVAGAGPDRRGRRHPVRRPAARRHRRRHRPRGRRRACARSSTSSATRPSAPRTTRARPPASSPPGSPPSCCGVPIASTGTTTFRPPYTPVAFAALAGRDRGRLFDPERVTAPARLARRGRARSSRTSASGSAPATTRGPVRTWTPPSCASAPPRAPVSASSTARRSARSTCRAPTPPCCSTCSTRT